MPAPRKEHPELTRRQGQTLIELVRQTLKKQFKRRLSEKACTDLKARLQNDIFNASCGAFVTLKIGGRLRGCIGSFTGQASLIDCVRSNAVNAAFHDPRFSPLTDEELDLLTIEVSVLTPPKPLEYHDAGDLIEKLRPYVDGVTIRLGTAGATFLPQVWEQLPEKEDFLAQLCRKAGLASDAWRANELEVETYQVQYFESPI